MNDHVKHVHSADTPRRHVINNQPCRRTSTPTRSVTKAHSTPRNSSTLHTYMVTSKHPTEICAIFTMPIPQHSDAIALRQLSPTTCLFHRISPQIFALIQHLKPGAQEPWRQSRRGSHKISPNGAKIGLGSHKFSEVID